MGEKKSSNSVLSNSEAPWTRPLSPVVAVHESEYGREDALGLANKQSKDGSNRLNQAT